MQSLVHDGDATGSASFFDTLRTLLTALSPTASSTATRRTSSARDRLLSLSGGAKKNRKLQLKYFNARGAAETARLIFKIAGKDFDDHRFEITPGKMRSPDFETAREAGELKANLNRAPVLVTEKGAVIGQSKAIERYLARRFNLMGKNPEEQAMIDAIAEHCRDVRDAQMRKGFSRFSPKKEKEKAVARKEWFSKDLPVLLEKIDASVRETGSAGYSVGSSMSLADIVIFSTFRDGPPSDKEENAKALEKFSALSAIVNSVESHPAVAKWLESRPETAM